MEYQNQQLNGKIHFRDIQMINLWVFFPNRFFNDQELKNTPKTKIESKQNTHTLTLPKAELTDEGVYKCIATNPDGTIETKANISVCSMFIFIEILSFELYFSILAKPKVDGKVNDVTVQINEPAELRTKFSAIPKPTITWFVHFHSSMSI